MRKGGKLGSRGLGTHTGRSSTDRSVELRGANLPTSDPTAPYGPFWCFWLMHACTTFASAECAPKDQETNPTEMQVHGRCTKCGAEAFARQSFRLVSSETSRTPDAKDSNGEIRDDWPSIVVRRADTDKES